MTTSVIIALLTLATVALASGGPRISTPSSGTLIGTSIRRPSGTVSQFLGVPYAQPPVGSLRFQPPLPLTEDLGGVRDATRSRPACVQPPHLKEVLHPLLDLNDGQVSEDCLYLNVYVPEQAKTEGPLPVMVWLPGEGFDFGVATHFDGSYLASLGHVIVVTVQYRVSVFGFLSTASLQAPGNVGLLDQRMALKWVQKNIAAFGGSPNNVTLFGRFTGSMSASMQLTSPLNIKEPLFQRVILQSGIATGNWVFEPQPRLAAELLGSLVGCNNSSVQELVSCLQTVPAESLLANSFFVPQRFRPTLDGTFLTHDPIDSISEGRYVHADVLLGHNKEEGSLCLLTHYALKTSQFENLMNGQLSDQEFKIMISRDLVDFYKSENGLAAKVAAHEYRFLPQEDGLPAKYSAFCGEMYVTSRVERVARLLGQQGRVSTYLYQFEHRPVLAPLFPGHGNDVAFTMGLVFKEEDSMEQALSRQTIQAITNFAKSSDPSFDGIQWPAYTSSRRPVLHFRQNGSATIQPSQYDRAVAFWYEVIPATFGGAAPSQALPSGDLPSPSGEFLSRAQTFILVLAPLTVFVAIIFLVSFRSHLSRMAREVPFRKL